LTEYNLSEDQQPICSNTTDYFIANDYLLRSANLHVGKWTQYINMVVNREFIMYNNAQCINIRYTLNNGKFNLSVSTAEVLYEKIEEKERFVDEEVLDEKNKGKVQPGKDVKKIDKVKDTKKTGKKGEEAERKKEIYFETYTAKLCDSTVCNVK